MSALLVIGCSRRALPECSPRSGSKKRHEFTEANGFALLSFCRIIEAVVFLFTCQPFIFMILDFILRALILTRGNTVQIFTENVASSVWIARARGVTV